MPSESKIFVSDSQPSDTEPVPPTVSWFWIRPDPFEVYGKKEDGNWELLFKKGGDTPDVNFTGEVKANGKKGITGSLNTPLGRITVTKGIITGFNPP